MRISSFHPCRKWGLFSKAYEALAQEGTPLQQHSGEVWKLIWDKGELVPRIRLFAWKLMHEALPLAKVIQSRTGKVDPICATCGQAEEDLSHMLWQCAFSRCCWLNGSLPIISNRLPNSVQQVFLLFNTDEMIERWPQFLNSIWAIWRCHNDRAYSGLELSFGKFQKYKMQIDRETLYACTGVAKRRKRQPAGMQTPSDF